MYQRQSHPEDTTRRLSALLYYDQKRTHEVLDLIVGKRHRFLVRYDDIDTTVVSHHAASALRMWRRYCLLAFVALVFMVVASVGLDDSQIDRSFWTILIGAIVSTVFILFLLWLVGVAVSLVGRFSGLVPEDPGRLVVVATWVIAAPLVLVSLWTIGSFFSTLVLSLFAVFLVYFHQAYTAHRLLVERFQSENWDGSAVPEFDPDLRAPIEEIALTAGSVNSTIYSGFIPFVGSGFLRASFRNALEVGPAAIVDEASVARRSRMPVDDLPPHPSEVQIMAELIDGMNSLDLPNFRARRWHFVHGLHVDSLSATGTDPSLRPSGSVDGQAVVDGTISDEFARSYLWLSSSIWGGDVVFNTFVRLVPGPSGLFVEITHHVLPPVSKEAARCESEVSREGLDLFAQTTLDAAQNVIDFPRALRWFVGHRFRWARTRRRIERQASKLVPVDRGAEISIRDIFTTNEYYHYFQVMDGERYRSIINTSILTKIDDSLRKSGWAIADLREIVQNLQNITIDNSTNIKDSSFGDNAQIRTGAPTGGNSSSGGSTS